MRTLQYPYYIITRVREIYCCLLTLFLVNLSNNTQIPTDRVGYLSHNTENSRRRGVCASDIKTLSFKSREHYIMLKVTATSAD